MSELQFLLHPETCFPVRGEYFRAPISKRTVWYGTMISSGSRIIDEERVSLELCELRGGVVATRRGVARVLPGQALPAGWLEPVRG